MMRSSTIMVKRPWDLVPLVKNISDITQYIESTLGSDYQIHKVFKNISIIQKGYGVSHTWKDGSPVIINKVLLKGPVLFVGNDMNSLQEEDLKHILRSYFKQLRDSYEQR